MASGISRWANFSAEGNFTQSLWHALCITVKTFTTFYGSSMFSPLERRRFSRLIIPLPVCYHTFHPESGELHQGCGVIRDISLSGGYFHLEHPVVFPARSAPLPDHCRAPARPGYRAHFPLDGPGRGNPAGPPGTGQSQIWRRRQLPPKPLLCHSLIFLIF